MKPSCRAMLSFSVNAQAKGSSGLSKLSEHIWDFRAFRCPTFSTAVISSPHATSQALSSSVATCMECEKVKVNEWMDGKTESSDVCNLTSDTSECVDEPQPSAVGGSSVKNVQLSLKMSAAVAHSSSDASRWWLLKVVQVLYNSARHSSVRASCYML